MSKKATVECRIKQADPRILQKAVEHLIRMKDGRVRLIDKNKLSVFCRDLSYYNIDIKIVNGQLEITGEDIDMQKVKDHIEQFYIATEMEEEFNTPMSMDENGDLVLTVEV